MKRRNFFTKIAKGLLGIGIVTALPTPEVETAPEQPAVSMTDDHTYKISGLGSPNGISFDGTHIYVTVNRPYPKPS